MQTSTLTAVAVYAAWAVSCLCYSTGLMTSIFVYLDAARGNYLIQEESSKSLNHSASRVLVIDVT